MVVSVAVARMENAVVVYREEEVHSISEAAAHREGQIETLLPPTG